MARTESKKYNDLKHIEYLKILEKKVLWLSAWTIHNANHIRESSDGLKVGGHQASCASVVSLMTALYFDILTPADRVAVKPHASPVFHAIQYLMRVQTKDNLKNFRSLGGAQSYPSRTKDIDDVNISTGSVGLGVGMTLFASMVRDYIKLNKLNVKNKNPGRLIAIMGDAELDEGNVFEALLEGWKHDVKNLWWMIDYNRQSLDRVVSDKLFQKIRGFFEAVGWKVVILKYGKLQQAAFECEGGPYLKQWIDDCPNELYCALTFKGGASWRQRLLIDLGDKTGIRTLLSAHTDEELQALMTNLAGHDVESILECLRGIKSDVPHCFIIYTIKGYGLPFAGHKDNHAGLMNPDQMADFQKVMKIKEGEEWDLFSGVDIDKDKLKDFIEARIHANTSFALEKNEDKIKLPIKLEIRKSTNISTQEAFGRILNDLGRGNTELAKRIVTTSPDVTVSTNLGGWVNQRGLFNRADREDIFNSEKVVSMQKWAMSKNGQHIELGIAENNLFLLLAALGLSDKLFGARLIPIGTVYDPFIARGLDALNYACYQDARFILAGTPSGISLAPEGGAHQSISTPLIGMGQPGLTYFEPAYADELSEIMLWAFNYMQEEDGGSVYLRLSTKTIIQPIRAMTPHLKTEVIQGAYWKKEPTPDSLLSIVYCGAIAGEAEEAHKVISEDLPGTGLLAITSPDQLYSDWQQTQTKRLSGKTDASSHIETLLHKLNPGAALITVIDGHPATLSWLAGVSGHKPYSLGVSAFGESGNVESLYDLHKIDSNAVIDMAALACIEQVQKTGN